MDFKLHIFRFTFFLPVAPNIFSRWFILPAFFCARRCEFFSLRPPAALWLNTHERVHAHKCVQQIGSNL